MSAKRLINPQAVVHFLLFLVRDESRTGMDGLVAAAPPPPSAFRPSRARRRFGRRLFWGSGKSSVFLRRENRLRYVRGLACLPCMLMECETRSADDAMRCLV